MAADASVVTYRDGGSQAAELVVETSRTAVVVIRNVFDPNWHAAVDGRPATLLPVDYVIQGVVVAPGRHRITLSYDDRSIGFGLLGSVLSLAVLLGLALASSSTPSRYESPA
jgi:hypothetical protein